MASGETLPRGSASHHTGASQAEGAGQAAAGDRHRRRRGRARRPVVQHRTHHATQPAVLRMVPIAAAIRHALRGSGTVVLRPRFGLRGWNGDAGRTGR